MSGRSYTVEHHMRVYDDQHGSYVTVRPDPDTGDLCHISTNEGGKDDQDSPGIIIPWPMARLMAQAILSANPEDAA